jgi:4a-hydroxytetrahydrobiopterin dehydratase
MLELRERKCVLLDQGTPPLAEEEIRGYLERLPGDWEVVEGKMIRKNFPFENFKRGMAFAQEIGLLAERENHHPDLCIRYTGVEVELSTHVVGGLSVNDFILAAKIENI